MPLRLDASSKSKANPEKQREQRAVLKRSCASPGHHDRQVHTKKTTFLKTVFPMSAPYWEICSTSWRCDSASLRASFARANRQRGSSCATSNSLRRVLAEPLRDPKACESGETTDAERATKLRAMKMTTTAVSRTFFWGRATVNQLAQSNSGSIVATAPAHDASTSPKRDSP